MPERPEPRHPPDPYDRLRDPEVRRRYGACLISLLLLTGALPFLGISYLAIRTAAYQSRLAPLSSTERWIAIAAEIVFFWSALALVWGIVFAWRYLRARRASSRQRKPRH